MTAKAKLISPTGEVFWDAYGPMVKEQAKATHFNSLEIATKAANNRFGRSGIAFWESEKRHERLAHAEYRDWTFVVVPDEVPHA